MSRDWQRGSDLALLIAGQLLTFGLKEGERVELIGPSVNLSSRAAVLLALVFHELAAEAVLSLSLDGAQGALRVSWRIVEGGPDKGLSVDWVVSKSAQDIGKEEQTSWAEWIEQAIAHQLVGTLPTGETKEEGVGKLHLPCSALA